MSETTKRNEDSQNGAGDDQSTEMEKYDAEMLEASSWRPHMCQFFREAVLRVSRSELAHQIKVSSGAIREWENPRSKIVPSLTNLRKLCKAFECKPFELYTDFNPAHTRQFLDDIFKTWSFVLQQSIRSESVGEKKFALSLTQLFMDYDERRRAWEAEDPQDEASQAVEDELQNIMFNQDAGNSDGNEPDIEEGVEDEEDSEIKMLPEAS